MGLLMPQPAAATQELRISPEAKRLAAGVLGAGWKWAQGACSGL